MLISDITSGLLIGLPIMVTLGPISLLLLNQGMERGAREALPGALGVATADMTYSGLAALTGAALVAILNPIAPVLRVVGVAVLLWMAWNLARSSRRDVAALRQRSVGGGQNGNEYGGEKGGELWQVPTDQAAPLAGHGPSDAPGVTGLSGGADAMAGATAVTVEAQQPVLMKQAGAKLMGRRRKTAGPQAAGQGPFAHLVGPRLAAAFFGLTLMNPMTILLMSAVVIAGGRGIGTVGWAIGMTLASLTAHGGYVLVGSVLRRTCGEMTLARMGMVSSVVLVALSAHLAIT